MATDKLLAEAEGTIGKIIFNNPERRNAVSPDMWDGIEEALDKFIPDDAIRVIVLTGAGGKSFVSGSDISAFDKVRSTPEQIEKYNETSHRVHKKLMECPKPTIAMINGFCMGGGAGFALDCDLRICSDKSQFGIPAAKLGLGYKFSSINRLVDVVGPANAKEILFTGGRFSAQEAHAMGLVNRVVPEAELESTVMEYAQTIGDNAPMTIASIKTIIANIVKDPADRDLDECTRMVDACFKSEDYIEGRTAFMEKRKPNFKGR